jgi:hypothetical protein
MVEVCHYRGSPVLSFDDVDNSGLWPLPIHTFGIFGSFDILYDKPFEIILQPSDEGQIYLKGRLSGNTLFFYLSDKHFGVCVRGALLNPDGPYFAESEQYSFILCNVVGALVYITAELESCWVTLLDSRR